MTLQMSSTHIYESVSKSEIFLLNRSRLEQRTPAKVSLFAKIVFTNSNNNCVLSSSVL